MFKCQECGRKFRTEKAARKAAFGDRGCPGCGGSDIDLDPSVSVAARLLRRSAPGCRCPYGVPCPVHPPGCCNE